MEELRKAKKKYVFIEVHLEILKNLGLLSKEYEKRVKELRIELLDLVSIPNFELKSKDKVQVK